MGISFYTNLTDYVGQKTRVNVTNPQLPNFCPRSNIARQLCNDVFEKINTDNCAKASAVLNNLFPNGELDRIYQHITEYYKLENPPKMVTTMLDSRIGAEYLPNKNIVLFNPLILNNTKNNQKFRVEFMDSNGEKRSCYIPNYQKEGTLLYLNDEKQIQQLKEAYKQNGINVIAEPTTEKDIKQIIIHVLAHELRHASQMQAINQSEGLGIYNLLKDTYTNRASNLIEKKIIEHNFNKEFRTLPWAKTEKKIKYKKGTEEWDRINMMYNSFVRYKNCIDDVDDYIKNIVEIDADKQASEYIKKYFPEYSNVVDEETRKEINKKFKK